MEYYGAFHLDGTISIYTEYMDAGGLDTLLISVGRFPEPIIIQFAHAIVQGLFYLWQDLHIAHRWVAVFLTFCSSVKSNLRCNFRLCLSTQRIHKFCA